MKRAALLLLLLLLLARWLVMLLLILLMILLLVLPLVLGLLLVLALLVLLVALSVIVLLARSPAARIATWTLTVNAFVVVGVLSFPAVHPPRLAMPPLGHRRSTAFGVGGGDAAHTPIFARLEETAVKERLSSRWLA